MRFKLPFLFLLASFCISSCNDAPEVGPVTLGATETIVGEWVLEGIDVFIEDRGISVTEESLETNYYTNAVYNFNDDGTFSFIYSDGEAFPGEYRYEKESKELILIEKEEGEEDYELKYFVEFTENGITISTPTINALETELFSEDGFYLFEAIALLEDQEEDLEDFGEEGDENVTIKYYYKQL